MSHSYQISSAESQIRSHNSNISKYNSQLLSAKSKKRDVESKVNELESKLDSQNTLISKTTSKIQDVERKIYGSNQEIENQTSLISQKVAQACDQIEGIYMPNRERMNEIEIGDSIAANNVESQILGQWNENQRLIAKIQSDMKDALDYQEKRQAEITKTKRFLDDSKIGLTGLEEKLKARLRDMTFVSKGMETKYIFDTANIISQIRFENYELGRDFQIGDFSPYVLDKKEVEMQTVLPLIAEHIKDQKEQNRYIALGILGDARLLEAEFWIIDKKIDPRVARLYTLLAITQDWVTLNQIDFDALKAYDERYCNAARIYVTEFESEATNAARVGLQLINERLVDKNGVLATEEELESKDITGISRLLTNIRYVHTHDATIRYLRDVRNLNIRNSEELKLIQQRDSIFAEQANIRNELDKLINDTIIKEIRYELGEQVGNLMPGSISLFDIIKERQRLQAYMDEQKRLLSESKERYKQLDARLSTETSSLESTDFLDADKILDNYLSGIILKYDDLTLAQKQKIPKEMLRIMEKTDSYLDDRRAAILAEKRKIEGYNNEREGYLALFSSQQHDANSIERQMDIINGELARAQSAINIITASIASEENSISSLRSKINTYKSLDVSESLRNSSLTNSSFTSHAPTNNSFRVGGNSGGGSIGIGRR